MQIQVNPKPKDIYPKQAVGDDTLLREHVWISHDSLLNVVQSDINFLKKKAKTDNLFDINEQKNIIKQKNLRQ